MKRILVSLLSLLLTFSLLMPISANDDNASSNTDKPQVSEPTESEEVPSDVNKTPSNTNESGQPNDGGAEDNEDGSSTLACDVNQGAVACVGDVGYKTFEKAIQAANDNQGTEELTLTIIQSGEYPDFQLTRDNVIIQAQSEVEAVFKMKEGSENLAKFEGDNIVVSNLIFNAKESNVSVLVYVDGNNNTFNNCKFIGDGNVDQALAYHGERDSSNLNVENCSFDNFNRGFYSCGDHSKLTSFIFEGNEFKNIYVPIDGYWGYGYEESTPNLVINNNYFDSGTYGKAYIQFWDYAQYSHWVGNNDRNGSALNVEMKNNTYVGDVEVYATHCNWYVSTTMNIDEETSNRLTYRNLVVLEGVVSAKLLNSDGSEITKFNEKTISEIRNGKQVIYSISEGNYIIIGTTEDGETISKQLTVSPQIPNEDGETNKVEFIEEDKYVASVGDDNFASINDAIIKSQETGKPIVLKQPVILDENSNINLPSNVSLDGNGNSITCNKLDSCVILNDNSNLSNITINHNKTEGKYAVQAYKGRSILNNVTINDKSEKYAGILVNGADVNIEGNGISYFGTSYVFELGKGEGLNENPSLLIDASVTSSENDSNKAIYVDLPKDENIEAKDLLKLGPNAKGLIPFGSNFELDENGQLIITRPSEGGSTSPDHNWVYRPSVDSEDEEVKEYTTAEKSKACVELLGKGWTYSEKNKSCVYTLDSNTQQIPNTSTK